MFLQAAKRVTEDRSDVAFIIVGDGGEHDQLAQTIIDLGIQNHVYLVGWKRDIAAVYADLDLLALTSLNEGTPAAIIEAMASGVPVIATSVGGVPDLVEDNRTGFLVPSEDVELLSKGLLELINDSKLRERLGVAARSEAVRRFSHQRLVGDIRDLVSHLKVRGIGVLITDHNVRETLRITDRAYIVHDGAIFRSGTPAELASDEDVKRIYLGADFRLD